MPVTLSKQRMMVCKYTLLGSLIRCRNRIITTSYNFAKFFVFVSFLCNHRQIVRGCIMVFIMKSVRIDKMCIFTSDFLGFLIHHFHKAFYASANLHCHLCRNFIS